MNLFRSEEHVRRWAKYDAESTHGIKLVREIAAAFNTPLITERLEPDYVRQIGERIPGLLEALDRLGGGSPFWQLPPAAGSDS
jgi:hypothetical protein